ncbi:hypothetical protein NSA47_04690 [Irregularibacter muris]|uniref:DUF5668 domain-containing protein n=1 Tax=Irregularibacter muris TaxID=1796619 RepID=A0AAE3HD63_9FIRM|nr:hypothetical protein [Irregularibacter muris]MCR1898285.1 hypothetical protein [Irregularibacter muris]
MEPVVKKKVGVITLAVGLIAIGSLWTIQNIYPTLWIPKAAHFWPILLILYGIELLVTKFLYENKQGFHVTIDIGIIILLIFFVIFMGGVSVVQSILPQIIREMNLG